MNETSRGLLEVMSGPQDGETLPVREPWVIVGPVPDALLPLSYDPTVPEGGVRIKLSETGVEIGSSAQAGYGELFKVGQVWMRVLAPEEGAC